MRRSTLLGLLALSAAILVTPVSAQIASDRLEIRGLSLTVETVSVTTPVNVPVKIQTAFGGRPNEQPVPVPGLVAVGELTGPGFVAPLRLTTAPGGQFHVAGLPTEGTYLLQNIRLMSGDVVLRQATPSVATITVTDALQATLSVRQLSPEEIRSRGIVVDAGNYEV